MPEGKEGAARAREAQHTPSEAEQRSARACFHDGSDEGVLRFLSSANQRELVAKYKQVYNRREAKHLNAFLRSALLSATGLPQNSPLTPPPAPPRSKLPRHRRPPLPSRSSQKDASSPQKASSVALPGIATGKRSLQRPVKPKRVRGDEDPGVLPTSAVNDKDEGRDDSDDKVKDDGSDGGTNTAEIESALADRGGAAGTSKSQAVAGAASRSSRKKSGGLGRSKRTSSKDRRSRGGGANGMPTVHENSEPHAVEAQSNEKYGAEIVGKRVCVYWPEENMFFPGTVVAHDASSGKHHIEYDDNDEEDVLLEAESFYFEAEPKAVPFEQVYNSRQAKRELCVCGYVVLARTQDGSAWPAQIKSTSSVSRQNAEQQPAFFVRYFNGSDAHLSLESLADFSANLETMRKSCSSHTSALCHALTRAKEDYDRHTKGASRRSGGAAESPEEIERRVKAEREGQRRSLKKQHASQQKAREASQPPPETSPAPALPDTAVAEEHRLHPMAPQPKAEADPASPIAPGAPLSGSAPSPNPGSPPAGASGAPHSGKRKPTFAQPSRKRAHSNGADCHDKPASLDSLHADDAALKVAKRLLELVDSGTPDVLSEGDSLPSEDDRKRLIEELSLFDDVLAIYRRHAPLTSDTSLQKATGQTQWQQHHLQPQAAAPPPELSQAASQEHAPAQTRAAAAPSANGKSAGMATIRLHSTNNHSAQR